MVQVLNDKRLKVNPSVAPRRLIDATIPFKAIAPIIDTFLPRF